MCNVADQIDDWETRACCPFCSYDLSEAWCIRKWLTITLFVQHTETCVRSPGLQRSQLKQRLTVFAKIVEFPWAHLYPKGEWSERLAWSCPRMASARGWIRIFFHEAFGVETDPCIFSSVWYVYKRSDVPRNVDLKDYVNRLQIWCVCLGEKPNTVHHYSLIRSLQSLSGGHVTSEIQIVRKWLHERLNQIWFCTTKFACILGP